MVERQEPGKYFAGIEPVGPQFQPETEVPAALIVGVIDT